ncbi:MAG TPA: S8 family serine peptidase [Candidatus Thermoplasmatota archaeon]|nr:S8 family serine peptidase [Candidatus Thermoplasmatota archaeon]
MRSALLAAALFLALTAPAAAEVTVAVLDSGVDGDHAELAGRVEHRSFLVGTPLPLPPLATAPLADDPDGQGTGVASLVAGSTLGVDGDARILDLQVALPQTGTDLDPGSESAAIDAMDLLLREHGGPDSPGTRVALLSFASAGLSDQGAATLAAQAESLFSEGVAVVVPAAPSPSALHQSPFVLVVGETEEPCPAPSEANGPPKPDLVAPGEGLTVATPGIGPLPGGTGTASGAPYAAAQVAGAAALMLEARPDLPLAPLYDLLRDSATDFGDPGFDACTGFGELDVEAAVEGARAWSDPLGDAPDRGSPGLGLLATLGSIALGLLAGRRSK